MDSDTESPMAIWSAPECPFTMEYSPRVMDDIRLAVVDAFFSLPRGGAEIGGVLLGTFGDSRLTVGDYLPLDCEHAFGPSFTLSPHDLAALSALLASPAAHAAGLRPVGWYHSHTRSEIFLSEADQEIHNRYFPEPWQVALVLKPHTFQPTRAGFFFRDAVGKLHGEASFSEFQLEPLAVRPLPGAMTVEERPLIGPAPAVEPPAAAPTPVPEPPAKPPIPPPRFLAAVPEKRSRRWLKMLAAAAAIAGLGAFGFETRSAWLPRVVALGHRAPTAAQSPPENLGLNTVDEYGQLHITWRPTSPLVRDGANAVLLILDIAPDPQEIKLDDAHLRSGSFTYQRQSERVDVTLELTLPDGRQFKEATSFLGKLPVAPEPVADPAVAQERDELLQSNTRLETELKSEIARRKRAEKSLDDLRQQQRRMSNQLVR